MKSGYFKLTSAEVIEMRRLRFSDPKGWTVTRLAARYGVAISQVSKICNRQQRARDFDKYHKLKEDDPEVKWREPKNAQR